MTTAAAAAAADVQVTKEYARFSVTLTATADDVALLEAWWQQECREYPPQGYGTSRDSGIIESEDGTYSLRVTRRRSCD
jgi:hypothetical protein